MLQVYWSSFCLPLLSLSLCLVSRNHKIVTITKDENLYRYKRGIPSVIVEKEVNPCSYQAHVVLSPNSFVQTSLLYRFLALSLDCCFYKPSDKRDSNANLLLDQVELWTRAGSSEVALCYIHCDTFASVAYKHGTPLPVPIYLTSCFLPQGQCSFYRSSLLYLETERLWEGALSQAASWTHQYHKR